MTKSTGNIESVFAQLALLAVLCSFWGGSKGQSATGNSLKTLTASVRSAKKDSAKIKLELKLNEYYLDKDGELKDDHDSAFTFLDQAQRLSNSLHFFKWQIKSLKFLGDYYLQRQDLKSEEICFMQVIDYFGKSGYPMQHAKTWSFLGNSNMSQDVDSHVREILKKQTQLLGNEAEKSRTFRNFSIALSLMSLIILGLGYNQYRLKRRSNLLLEINQKTISAKNTHLEKLLRENEWLIKEVHHRVKNNMQLVISLLTSQCDTLTDPSAVQAITESRHRIQAMALIHQKLYATDYASSIYMPEYVNELIDYLRECFEKGRLIFFDVEVAGIRLAVHQAIPLGLILNETITNAMRYAFPRQLDCVIKIRFLIFNKEEAMLVVSDNGAGFNYEQVKRDSFGLLLLKGLTEELGGTFTLESSEGTTITSVFKHNID